MDLSFLSPVSSAIGSLMSGYQSNLANLNMSDYYKKSAEAQMLGVQDAIKTNDLNFQLQRENLDYQKSLQNIIFGREDNAVQRRVDDLRKAGLSPTLAAGSAAGVGQAISTSAPQKMNNLEAMVALSNIQTRLAEQQRSQTEADIAKQRLFQENFRTVLSAVDVASNANNLYQNLIDTKYLKDRGLSKLEVNQDWKLRLLNLMYPKLEEALFGTDTKSGLFGAITDSLVYDLKNRPASGVTVDSKGDIVSPNGSSTLTTYQVAKLKQVGLYREWLNAGLTDNVKKALGMK